MKKMILLAVAGYFWRRYQTRNETRNASRADTVA